MASALLRVAAFGLPLRCLTCAGAVNLLDQRPGRDQDERVRAGFVQRAMAIQQLVL
jgi:hypothetical protein